MLISILSAFFVSEVRDLASRFASLNVTELLNRWELPALILLSLSLQIVLVTVGTQQRYRGNFLVSLTYWLADWVANVALTVILKNETKERSKDIKLLWTSFLLLHLGGQDSIGSNPSEDGLWKKHLLGICIQVGMTGYVFARFWTNATLTYMVIPIFIAGIIKYGERIMLLWSWSRLRNSLLARRNAAKHLDTILTNGSTSSHIPQTLDEYLREKNVTEEGKYFRKAFYLCKMNRALFFGHRLRIHRNLREFFMLSHSISAEDAFKIVQIELGFLYDMLCTKTAVLQSKKGILLRSICLLSTFAALIAFAIAAANHVYPKEDIYITFLLFSGAILVDIYSAMSRAFSDWTMFYLSMPSNKGYKFLGGTIASRLVHSKAKKKGITSMAQHSLIDYCLKVNTSCWTSILRVVTEDFMGKFWYTSWEKVNPNLKNFIHSHLQEKFIRFQNIKDEASREKIDKNYEEFDHQLLSSILKERGDRVLQGKEIVFKDEFKWGINDVEFSHSILLWHIATFLLFYDDNRRYHSNALGSYCQISKLLSNYMMYLLLVKPLMLSKGIGQVRIRDTQEEVIRFFGHVKSPNNNDAAGALLHIENEFSLSSFHTKSVLRDGCKLASMLKALGEELQWDLEDVWEMIANVWMEMLAFAASKCRWEQQTRELRHGEELLTHVALLMAHLGLIEQSTEWQSLKWDWEQLSHMSYYLA